MRARLKAAAALMLAATSAAAQAPERGHLSSLTVVVPKTEKAYGAVIMIDPSVCGVVT